MSRNLTSKEKTVLRRKIRREIEAGTFSQQSFSVKERVSYHTVRRLVSQDPELDKKYKAYRKKQQDDKKTKSRCSSKAKPEYKGQEVEKDFKEKTGVVTIRRLDIKTVDKL